MAKGLDVGTSFIVLAEEAAKGKVKYKDFRDAFYVIKPSTPIANEDDRERPRGKDVREGCRWFFYYPRKRRYRKSS